VTRPGRAAARYRAWRDGRAHSRPSLLRRATPGQKSEIDEVLWEAEGRLSPVRSFATSVIPEVVIGLGASIGRESAPKLLGGVAGSLAADWAGLTSAQRRLLVACGGGAGLACAYNVPLGGGPVHRRDPDRLGHPASHPPGPGLLGSRHMPRTPS
jgi:hypothetical protein